MKRLVLFVGLANIICFCLSTQGFLQGILVALCIHGRKIDFNLCVEFCFGLHTPTLFLWPSAFLAFWKLLVHAFLKVVFSIFWFSLPSLSHCLLIVKSISKHFFFVEFSLVLCCKLAKCFIAYSSIIKFQSCLEHFWKVIFVLLFENLVLLSWTLFWFSFLFLSQSTFLFVLKLAFSVWTKWTSTTYILSKHLKWQIKIDKQVTFISWFRVVLSFASACTHCIRIKLCIF